MPLFKPLDRFSLLGLESGLEAVIDVRLLPLMCSGEPLMSAPEKDDMSRIADPMTRLVAIMARLRDPDGGCPWDIEQTFRTIAPYTIEEAYEVADAIEHPDP